jgi:hypothetical protein
MSKLNPYLISGFLDAESTLAVKFYKRKSGSYRVQPIFVIQLHKRDILLLEQIQSFFGVGTIIIQNTRDIAVFSVSSLKDLTNVIIPHLVQYPLLTQKRADFLLFKSVVYLMNQKEHLHMEGLRKIVSLRASINLGFSEVLRESFPDITPVPRPVVSDQVIKDLRWLAGFATGEGCFFVNIQKSSAYKLGKVVSLKFIITQHERDSELLDLIIKYWNCGVLRANKNCKVVSPFYY